MARKIADGILLVALVITFGCFSYLLWEYYPQISGSSVTFFSNESGSFGQITGGAVFELSDGMQFYSNMKYKDKEIKFWIESKCEGEKRQDVTNAFVILSEKTILRFSEVDKDLAEIFIYCSEIAPESFEEEHFIAGEGGPSEIMNTKLYSVILTGKVSLFAEERCEGPQIAVHEILHALGFDHTTNKESIMYPVSDCKQEIDDTIIEKINELYSQEARADLYIKEARAELDGRYLNFEISIENQGLKDSDSGNIDIYAENEIVKSFSLESLKVGMSKTISVSNLRVSPSIRKIYFVVKDGTEISDENNRIEMAVSEN